jgi:hypothetical protein
MLLMANPLNSSPLIVPVMFEGGAALGIGCVLAPVGLHYVVP